MSIHECPLCGNVTVGENQWKGKNELTIGIALQEIRIRSGMTLRRFCLDNDLDPLRYSLIERCELRPSLVEYGEYMNLIPDQGKISEEKND